MKLFPALVISLKLNWSFAKLRRIEQQQHYTARDIQEYNTNIDVDGGGGESSASTHDIGILSSDRRLLPTFKCINKNIVECLNGQSVGKFNSGGTCEEACDGECCVGIDACSEFSGQICKDGVSCNGKKACYKAYIGQVFKSCYSGDYACYEAGYLGEIQSMQDSCRGMQSCGKAASMGGFIGEIENSCLGTGACFEAASDEGGINRIESSCVGDRACFYLAKGSYIGDVVDSCNSDRACYSTSWEGGFMQDVMDSCNAPNSCQALSILEEEEEEEGTGARRKLQRPDNAGRAKKNKGCPPHKSGCPSLTPADTACLEGCCNEVGSCQGDKTKDELEADGCSASCETPQSGNNRDATTERSFLYPWLD